MDYLPYWIIGLLLVIIVYLMYKLRTNSKNGLKDIIPGDSFKNDDVTAEEIISMVNEGHEQGSILASEAEMIHNIFDLDEKEAKDIMTPRSNVDWIDGEMSLIDAISYMIETGRSRYPVYLEEVDNIIGVLHIKDAFTYVLHNEMYRTSIKDIKDLIRDITVVPETLDIDALFKQMQKEKNHIVIVIDEYGQASGVVAMEDVLEEIVGNIEDEHDNEDSMIEIEAEGVYLMDGLVDFSEVVEKLELPVPENEFETLNGFLTSIIGKIPDQDDIRCINAYGYGFSILAVDNKIITQVRVEKREGNRAKEQG